jgi:hypothetical protein
MTFEEIETAFIKNLNHYVNEGNSLAYSRHKSAKDLGISMAKVWNYTRGHGYREVKERHQKKYIKDRKWVK